MNLYSERICDMIVQYGKTEKRREMASYEDFGRDRDLKKILLKKRIKRFTKKRNSNIVWMNDKWIYNEINLLKWQIKMQDGILNGIGQSCQFTIYKKGRYYDWHCDRDKPM